MFLVFQRVNGPRADLLWKPHIILDNSHAVIRTGGDKAFYSPAADFIQFPSDSAFRGPEYWATTALHELDFEPSFNVGTVALTLRFKLAFRDHPNRSAPSVLLPVLGNRSVQLSWSFSGAKFRWLCLFGQPGRAARNRWLRASGNSVVERSAFSPRVLRSV